MKKHLLFIVISVISLPNTIYGNQLDYKSNVDLKQNLVVNNPLQKSNAAENCVAGQAGSFPCNNIDLLAHVALNDFATNSTAANDVWGHYDLNDGKEYALIGLENGIGIVDVSDPESPNIVTTIASQSTIWRDIKVHQRFDSSENQWKSYAYVTAESTSVGLLIIDLNSLPTSAEITASNQTDLNAHNVYISNVDYSTGVTLSGTSPYLHVVGSSRSPGSFNTYSLANPTSLIRIFSPSNTGQGPSHDISSMLIKDSRKDTQCVNGDQNCEILFDFKGENGFGIWDKTDNAAPQRLSLTTYTNLNFAHFAWATEDQQVLIVNDELDEINVGLNTTVRFFDISDLSSPNEIATWTGSTKAIDHNGFVRGNRYYLSNYERGMTVLDITDPASPVEVGFFDTYPTSDNSNFNGAWGVYPFLPSGNILVSDIDSGLYILRDNTRNSINGRFKFSESIYTSDENTTVAVAVDRVDGSTGSVQISWELTPGSADNSDYVDASGTLEWAAGESISKTINIVINNNIADENTEEFFVRLFNPRNGATLAVPNLSKISITGTPINLSPLVNAGNVVNSLEGQQVNLTATASDPEGDALIFSWSQISGATVTLSSTNTLSTSFTPTTEGNYQFQFKATDTSGASSESTVNVTVSKPTPPTITPPASSGGGGSLGGLFVLLCSLGLIKSSIGYFLCSNK